MFPLKLFTLLNDGEAYSFAHVISWVPDGSAFRIRKPKLFCEMIMPHYFFKQSKYSSFKRQLYLYGFSKISSPGEPTTYFHPCFNREDKEACVSLRRDHHIVRVDRRRQPRKFVKELLTTRPKGDILAPPLEEAVVIIVPRTEFGVAFTKSKKGAQEALLQDALDVLEEEVNEEQHEEECWGAVPTPCSSSCTSIDMEPRSIEEMIAQRQPLMK